MDRPEPL